MYALWIGHGEQANRTVHTERKVHFFFGHVYIYLLWRTSVVECLASAAFFVLTDVQEAVVYRETKALLGARSHITLEYLQPAPNLFQLAQSSTKSNLQRAVHTAAW